MAGVKRTADQMHGRSAGGGGGDAVMQRKNKMRSARTIAVQSASPALRAGAIPVQSYLNARRFEVEALTRSMAKSREASMSRAFQTLPRYLRRRAASHNAKRVPKRLRRKALLEFKDTDVVRPKKTIPFKKKRGRRDTIRKLKRLQAKVEAYQEQAKHFQPDTVRGTDLPRVKPLPATRFANRQRKKTWLPSHMWTAKRARMQTHWDFSVPIHPNEKTYRSTHRALLQKGCIAFDTSYMAHIALHGPGEQLSVIVKALTRSDVPCSARAQRGKKLVHAHLHDTSGPLAPMTVLWSKCVYGPELRTVLLGVHPAVHIEAWSQACNLKGTERCSHVKVEDLRFQLGSMRLFGPTSFATLQSCLKPIDRDEQTSQIYRACQGLQPGELPANLVLPLEVKDPRPDHVFRLAQDQQPTTKLFELEDAYKDVPPSRLFSLNTLVQANEYRPANKGFKTDKAPAVPIVVCAVDKGVLLLAPWLYITDIWYAVNHVPLVRLGGQRELAQIHYETGKPFYPTDYRGTRAGDDVADAKKRDLEGIHDRRPPAKRVNYAKSLSGKPEHGNPFEADFDMLFGHLTVDEHLMAVREQTGDTIAATTADECAEQTVALPPEAADVVGSMAAQLDRVLPPKCRLVLGSILLADLSSGVTPGETGIVQVVFKMLERGFPLDRARVYRSEKKQAGALREAADLVGFVTTGNFSLSHGRGMAIGSVRADYAAACLAKAHASKRSKLQVSCSLRNVGTGNFHRATWQLILQ